jgi:hypothetical protein
MTKAVVIDALPRMMNDALNCMNGAYRANDVEAGAAHFDRFNKLWGQALERQKALDISEWRKVS